MLCLNDSIRHDDPCVQRALRALEEALTLTELLMAAWALARVVAIHVVEAVLAERARQPNTWPPCRCVVYLFGVGLCHTPGHEPVWAHALATSGRPVSPGVRHRSGCPF